jgi:hypothetical protein
MRYLIEQRVEFGEDDIDRGDQQHINNILAKRSNMYKEDFSLPIREHAEILFYNGHFRESIKTCLQAVIARPLKFDNWKLLQYCIRKSLSMTLRKKSGFYSD